MNFVLDFNIDEFNYLSAHNYLINKNNINYIILPSRFSDLAYNFNYVICLDDLSSLDRLDNNPFLYSEKRKEILAHCKKLEFTIEAPNYYKHVYDIIFPEQTKDFVEGRYSPVLPKKFIYEKCVNILQEKNINDRPVICILGRNLSKHAARNKLFQDIIIKSITAGAFVVSLTMQSPNLKFDEKFYMEAAGDGSDWSETISYLYLCNYAFIGPDAGVNNHLLAPVNCAIVGEGSYAADRNRGFNGFSLIEARKFLYTTDTFNSESEIGLEFIKNKLAIGPRLCSQFVDMSKFIACESFLNIPVA